MAETPRRRFHIALAVDDLEATIADYTERLGMAPVTVVPGIYALWRTPEGNLSVNAGPKGPADTERRGTERLRHVGFEDHDATVGPRETDVNGVQWETFTRAHQDAEIVRAYAGSA